MASISMTSSPSGGFDFRASFLSRLREGDCCQVCLEDALVGCGDLGRGEFDRSRKLDRPRCRRESALFWIY